MTALVQISDADVACFQVMRRRLFGIAYHVLGDTSEADDVVQDAWVRWQGTDRTRVRHTTAFLASATKRLALNVAQSARARHETSIGTWQPEPLDADADPVHGVQRADELEHAVRALLEDVPAAERAAYVLREAFDYPYRDVSAVLGVSEVNARQLVTRARLHIGGERRRHVTAGERQRFVDAFVAAAQTGDLAGLEELLVADLGASAPVAVAA